jgi:hypothetical protein
MKAAVLLSVVALVALIASALWWYLGAGGPAPSGIVAIVDVPGDYSTCSVGLNGSLHDVPCRDVGGYLRDTLKLRLDAGILIRPRGNADGHAMTEQVHAAGYLIVPYMGGIEVDPLDPVTSGPHAPAKGWAMEFIQQETGQYSRILGYPSKAACEAAIPAEMQRQRGDNGHCIEWVPQHIEGNPPKLVKGRFIGSQDPEQAGK